jgi:hypothetical protein
MRIFDSSKFIIIFFKTLNICEISNSLLETLYFLVSINIQKIKIIASIVELTQR